jgi:hypothetical protein
VFESIRKKSAAHLYEFDGGRYDPPEPGQPVITEISFVLEQQSRGEQARPQAQQATGDSPPLRQ